MVRNTAISGLDSFLLSTNVTSFSTKISLSFYFFKFCVQDLHLVFDFGASGDGVADDLQVIR